MRDEARRAQVWPFPGSRRLIVDIGRVTRRRPVINGFIEVDVTDVRRRLRAQPATTGGPLSLTAYLVHCVGRAVAADRQVHAIRDLRGRLVAFDDVDVTVSVEVELEGASFPMNHVIRRADGRSVVDISAELRRIKQRPERSPTAGMTGAARWFLRLPAPVRRAAFRLLYRLPRQQKALGGTVGLTAVGMVGRGGGWGTAFQVHPVEVVVGGITVRPGYSGDEVTAREYLQLTVGFDHDVVDGAPATRFTSCLRDLIEAPERRLSALEHHGQGPATGLGRPG